tara:strand:- start:2007 stop:2330 length:324 start_codon:yes stop_codon:yes gene_type:complete
MTQSTILKPEALRSLAFGSISGTYALVGSITNPSQLYIIQNLTNATITFSQDGVTDHFILPSMGFITLDIGTNKGTFQTLSVQAGTALYAKGSPGSGSVYITTFYMA